MGINDPEAIKRILDECKTIAVVGLSSNPIRPSYGVARYMQQRGYRIIPINPNETEVLGEKAYANIAEAPEKFDLVDIFRRSEEAGGGIYARSSPWARAAWMQEGGSGASAA